jgi:hypothetical protein
MRGGMNRSEPFARKLLLHSPIQDESLLDEFVEKCLADNVSIIACFGPGADELEEKIDWIVVGDGSNPERFVCTSAHVDEPLDDVIAMLECWEMDQKDRFEVIKF